MSGDWAAGCKKTSSKDGQMKKSLCWGALVSLLLVSLTAEAASWVRKNRKGLAVKSSKGKATVSYVLSFPKGWRFRKQGPSAVAIAPKSREIALAVRPIHKGDAGPEQLLNQKGGLVKWIAKVQPNMKKKKTLRIRLSGRKRDVLELRGKRRGRRKGDGKPFVFYAALVRVGDVNTVIIAGAPEKEWKRVEPTFKKMLARLQISSP